MRLLIHLAPPRGETIIPINYAYPLSAAIYKILRQAAPDYAHFLHEQGYPATSGRLMKLFTFSKLALPNVRLSNGFLHSNGGPCKLKIGSPMQDEFVQNFVLGLFEATSLTIAGQGAKTEFLIEQVEALPVPEFKSTMRFKCLSPIVASTQRDRDGRPWIYYYRPHDPELSQALAKNLLEKYRIIHGTFNPDSHNSDRVLNPVRVGDSLELHFRLEPHDKPKSKLVIIKEGTPDETRIKAFETYFTLEGSTELMRTAWECGLGEHNSQGFGMIEVV